MNRVDEGFEPPDALVEWCRSRTFPLHVLDDEATVNLDWWNAHLKDAGHTISLRGRDLDGKVITEGRAIVQRNDLRPSSDLVVAQHDGLGLLFLCAAWQGSHESRRFTRRFPNVFNPHHREDEDPLTQITAILDHCSKNKSMPVVRRDTWSGWPLTPGVGVSLMAAFMWAVGVQDEGRRAQMIDQYGVSTLIHEGWLEDPSVTGFTTRRYRRYCELLDSWAYAAGTQPEIVEMWLVKRWSARLAQARNDVSAPTLF